MPIIEVGAGNGSFNKVVTDPNTMPTSKAKIEVLII